MKTCSKCGETKGLDFFYKSERHAAGVYSVCKKCCRKKARDEYAANPEKRKSIQAKFYKNNPEARRSIRLKNLFGITINDFNAKKKAQKGKCAICHKKPKGSLCVDHSHKTGMVRGLLCRQCNHAIGLFYENCVSLKRAMEYLDAYNK